MRLSRVARRTLTEIAAYVADASESDSAGEAFVARLRAQCEKLAALPGTIGRPRPDIAEGVRSFAFRNYVILFRYRETTLDILNVVHGHRDVSEHRKGSEAP
jgi:toxin ParE1/3/4